MIDRNKIINKLKTALEPLEYIYAFWLEGADAGGRADEYSDLDFWVDFEDEHEEQAIQAVESALSGIAKIDFKYVMRHGHPKIRQRIYHLAGTSEYLMIDFCWQLHSRPREEYTYYENDTVEAVKVIFDKDNIIQYKSLDLSVFTETNRHRLEKAKYRRAQHIRAAKYIRRELFPEAYEAYNQYVLDPLIDLLRIIYTPAYADYHLHHISLHIPENDRKKLEYFIANSSLAEMAEKIPKAGEWFDELCEFLENKNGANNQCR